MKMNQNVKAWIIYYVIRMVAIVGGIILLSIVEGILRFDMFNWGAISYSVGNTSYIVYFGELVGLFLGMGLVEWVLVGISTVIKWLKNKVKSFKNH